MPKHLTRRQRATHLTAGVLAGVILAGSVAAYAATSPMTAKTSTNTILGCVNAKTHALAIANRCPKGTIALEWNETGANGSTGATGPQGEVEAAPIATAPPPISRPQPTAVTTTTGGGITGAKGIAGLPGCQGATCAQTLKGPAGNLGATGAVGTAPLAALQPWSLNSEAIYTAAAPATVVTDQQGTYELTNNSGKTQEPASDPADWTTLAAAGPNAAAACWAVVDPGAAAQAGYSTAGVIAVKPSCSVHQWKPLIATADAISLGPAAGTATVCAPDASTTQALAAFAQQVDLPAGTAAAGDAPNGTSGEVNVNGAELLGPNGSADISVYEAYPQYVAGDGKTQWVNGTFPLMVTMYC